MSLFSKLNWYRHRLQSMSRAEIMHRIGEAGKRCAGRRLTPSAGPEDNGPLPFLPGLREALRRWQVPEALLGEWQETLARAKSGRFFLLNREWPECEPQLKWHLDPTTGRFWPKDRYCFDIDYRHPADMGDVKYVWELGRLQYLQPIAALAFIANDTEAARFALAEIESWIDENPPYLGVHWASGIELSLRAVSILIVCTLAGEYATEAQRVKIKCTLYAHAFWLERFPSRFSSANNHRAAEGLGLFLLGALCTGMKDAGHFQDIGLNTLCDMAGQLILNDGTGAEQAITYAAFTAEMLLLALRVAHALEPEVPDVLTQRLALTGEYLRWFTDAKGNQPLIGDDDGGRVIGPNMPEERYATSVLNAIAATLHRPDLAVPGQKPHLRQALFGFPPSPSEPPTGLRTFMEGGYSVIRTKESLLAFDHGPLGYLSISAHGHADALGIWLHLEGAPVLVDAGTYLYHSGGDWRRHFRSTKAHNTLCLEAADASIMSGNFNWSHKASVHFITSHQTAPGVWHMKAEQDGYESRFNARHRRKVDVTAAEGFTVTDSIFADKTHRVEIGFLLHPLLKAVQESGAIRILKEARPILSIVHESPLAARIDSKESENPGWYSPSFGIKQPATRIVFAGVLAPEQKAVTRFTYGG